MNQPTAPAQAVDSRDVLKGLAFVLGAVLVYSTLHVGFRLLASSVLGEDDVVDTILVQDLKVAYDTFPRQPPLYDWVLWGVQQVLGPGVESFLVIKYAALTASAGFLYLAAYRVMRDRLFAVLSVESLALIYQISWRFHEGFTHEVGAMVAVMATAWLLLRTIDAPGPGNAIGLGIAAGLGFLTEPPYAVFLISMLIAAGLQPGTRRQIFTPWLVLSLSLAALIASPYVAWVLSEESRMAWFFRPSSDYWNDALSGLMDAIRSPIAYLSPLIFILPFVFPGFLRVAWGDLKGLGRAPALGLERSRLVLQAALVAWMLAIIGAVAFGIEGLPSHVLMPLYLTSVIWLFDVARRANGDSLHVGRFTRLALAIAVFAFCARLANMFVLDPVCNICRWGVPYAGLGEEMRARGFGDGTIVSIDKDLSGNLRAVFPGSKVMVPRYPRYTPVGVDLTQGDVAFVWGDDFSDKQARKYLRDLLPEGDTVGDAKVVSVPWRHLWRETGYRSSKWHLIVIDREQ